VTGSAGDPRVDRRLSVPPPADNVRLFAAINGHGSNHAGNQLGHRRALL